jgi:3-methyladenine DNA glycosylase AlkD
MPPTAVAPTANEILAQLKPLGTDAYKRVMANHGVREPFYGVKIEDLKKFQKRLKINHPLALDLYATGVYDAMYLAGLIADPQRMTKSDLRTWLANATSPPIAEYTVAWTAAASPHGLALALEWIDSKSEEAAATGWNTLCGIVSSRDDAQLDLEQLKQLLDRVARTIHDQPDRVRYTMNAFVIALGSHVRPLTEDALTAAKKIGKVTVDMGDTACKVPDAAKYIDKVKQRGALGKKRKSIPC